MIIYLASFYTSFLLHTLWPFPKVRILRFKIFSNHSTLNKSKQRCPDQLEDLWYNELLQLSWKSRAPGIPRERSSVPCRQLLKIPVQSLCQLYLQQSRFPWDRHIHWFKGQLYRASTWNSHGSGSQSSTLYGRATWPSYWMQRNRLRGSHLKLVSKRIHWSILMTSSTQPHYLIMHSLACPLDHLLSLHSDPGNQLASWKHFA